MKPNIKFTNIWADNDMIELEIKTTSENSQFSTKVYVGFPQIDKISEELNIFKRHIHGGLYDLEMGRFGPEYASGSLTIRFHFQDRGILHLTVNIQTEFYSFGKKEIADEATMHLKTEPALLDNFINSFKSIAYSKGIELELICIPNNG